jgi:hypothetical protein
MESVSSIKACLIWLFNSPPAAFSYDAAKYNRKAQVEALYHFLQR